MTEKTGWTRRAVLATKAALTGAMALPAASVSALGTATSAPSPTGVMPARWPTATARELDAFVGQRFRIKTANHGTLAVKLSDVQSPDADPARPAHLARRAGVSAIFDGPDAALLAEDGDGMHRISHPRIGSAEVYLKPLRRASGGYEIEMILN